MLELEPLYKQVHLHFQGLGQIEALLMTSFGLDVRYLEKRILPSFFPDLGEGPADEPHRPLFEYLEETPIPISVMFDASNLVSGDKPIPVGGDVVKELRWQAHPIQEPNGCFHPKLILALVVQDNGDTNLVVGCGSANLTQPGWGKNLEAFVLRTIRLQNETQDSMLVDVQELLNDLVTRAKGSEALQRLQRALTKISPKPYATRGYGWEYRPRLWHAAKGKGLTDFLGNVLHRDLVDTRYDWRLEVISPYYSDKPSTFFTWVRSQLPTVQNQMPPILCCCPQIDGEFDIDPMVANAYEVPGQVAWSTMPAPMIRSKLKSSSGEALTRFLHAKIFRFYCQEVEVIVCGSANATRQGCRDGNVGNYEACIIFSRVAPAGHPPKAWLQALETPLDAQSCRALPSRPDDQPIRDGMPNFSGHFDWASRQLRLDNQSEQSLHVFLGGRAHALVQLAPKQSESMVLSSDDTSAIFRSPTLRLADIKNRDAKWLCLIEETNLDHKPPAPTMEQTADELIQAWQQGFNERLADRVAQAELSSDQVVRTDQDEAWQDEVQSDRLNDVFLALWRFRRDIDALLGPDLSPDEFARSRLKARLFGAGAMSLRYFMARLQDAADMEPTSKATPFDPVELYVSLLTIDDALKSLSNRLKQAGYAPELRDLTKDLKTIKAAARKRLLNELNRESSTYPPKVLLEWVESHFRHNAGGSI